MRVPTLSNSKPVGLIAAAAAVVVSAHAALAAPTVAYTVGSVSALNPGGTPAASATNDAASNTTLSQGRTLAAFQTLISNAYANNTGGVLNFEEVDENGNFNTGTAPDATPTPAFSWPSQTNATNGLDYGNGQARALRANYGAGQTTATVAYDGTVATTNDPGGVAASNTKQLAASANNIVFWRDLYTANGGVPGNSGSTRALGVTGTTNTTQTATNDGIDANNGLNNSGATGVSPASGNGYLGIVGDGTPAVLDFTQNPLSAFAVTLVGRNSTRPARVALTLADGTVISSSTEAAAGTGTTNTFYGFQLSGADLAAHGGIIYTTFDVTSGNPDRFDDLAFVVAPTPEPASLAALVGLGGVMIRRRRRA